VQISIIDLFHFAGAQIKLPLFSQLSMMSSMGNGELANKPPVINEEQSSNNVHQVNYLVSNKQA